MQKFTRTGHFTQTDPIGLRGGVNLYGYALGDPVNMRDPFGLDPCFEGEQLIVLAGISGQMPRTLCVPLPSTCSYMYACDGPPSNNQCTASDYAGLAANVLQDAAFIGLLFGSGGYFGAVQALQIWGAMEMYNQGPVNWA